MSREKIYQSIWAAVLAFALVFGSLGCLATGMALLSGKALLSLALWCGFWAAALSALNLFRGAPWLALCIPVILAWRWFFGPLAASAERLVYEITSIYNQGYGWKVLFWTQNPTAASMMSAFRALAVVLLLPACHAMTRRGSGWTALPLTVLPLAATLALVDTVPKAGFLMLYLFGAVMLLLTQSVRRRQASQGNVLCLQLALPVGLMLALIFVLNPPKGYNKQHYAEKLDTALSSWLEGLLDREQEQLDGDLGQEGVSTPYRVDLDSIGPMKQTAKPVMTVNASISGRIYLRGASFSEYTGKSWLPGIQPDYQGDWPDFMDLQAENLTITTQAPLDIRYVPYYTVQHENMVQGRIPNNGRRTYSYSFYSSSAVVVGSRNKNAGGLYTDLPVSTAVWAESYVLPILGRQIDPDDPADVRYAINAIGDHVASSAKYSLDTPKMPEDALDFASWFLESSDTGYCTHFATAATVLLRGAGIPARYVTGYALQVQQGMNIPVTLAHAHAWVEVYMPGYGWTVFDPTPGAPSGQVTPNPTTPPQTTPQATQPDDTTEPDRTTPEQTLPGETTTGQTTPKPSEEASHPGREDSPRQGGSLKWMKHLLWPLAIVAVILGQWQLRLWLHRRLLQSRRGNRRAMVYWRRCEKLASRLRETPPEEIRSLALKAKFSQHKLTREELGQLRTYLTGAENRLRQHPWYRQLLYRLVWALY